MVDKKIKIKPARRRVESAFASNLQSVMKKHRLTQRKVGETCGVSVAVVNDWLSGAQPHDLNAVLKFCKAMKCDFKFMLTGEKSELSDLALSDIFDIEPDASFSGMFIIEAKRLRPKK